jgi:hypothetical protein
MRNPRKWFWTNVWLIVMGFGAIIVNTINFFHTPQVWMQWLDCMVIVACAFNNWRLAQMARLRWREWRKDGQR